LQIIFIPFWDAISDAIFLCVSMRYVDAIFEEKKGWYDFDYGAIAIPGYNRDIVIFLLIILMILTIQKVLKVLYSIFTIDIVQLMQPSLGKIHIPRLKLPAVE